MRLRAEFIIATGITLFTYLRSGGRVLVGGVDEAGRGSIIGPLVVAGISVTESELAELKRMGVRDSKLLTPAARSRLYGEILALGGAVKIHKAWPAEVDKSVMVRGLNKLEARLMARVIDDMAADEVYVDSCDVNPSRYRETIMNWLASTPRKLHSLHHADSISVAVSAASIIAKVTRDREVARIRSRFGPGIGSGYPSDRKTMKFIREWVAEKGEAPAFARKSWKPLRQMLDRIVQRALYDP